MSAGTKDGPRKHRITRHRWAPFGCSCSLGLGGKKNQGTYIGVANCCVAYGILPNITGRRAGKRTPLSPYVSPVGPPVCTYVFRCSARAIVRFGTRTPNLGGL